MKDVFFRSGPRPIAVAGGVAARHDVDMAGRHPIRKTLVGFVVWVFTGRFVDLATHAGPPKPPDSA